MATETADEHSTYPSSISPHLKNVKASARPRGFLGDMMPLSILCPSISPTRAQT